MIDFKQKYQATIFIDGEDMVYTSKMIKTLLDLFEDKSMIPNTFPEISLYNPKPEIRVKLSTTDNEWGITFGSQRIDIQKNPTAPKGSNLGDLKSFAFEAYKLFKRIIEKFNKKPKRIALITTFLLEEMTDEQFNKAYLNLFKPPALYTQNPVFEWNWRSVARKDDTLNDLSETFNVITSIKRIQGNVGDKNGVIPFDRIELSFDLNTFHGNTENRFLTTHIQKFYEKMPSWHESLCKQIEEAIYG